ncbi:hypothetical protein RISK_004042 [Rhodopirellula islandica]|uniref:Uncharacterized protein n=1 Tax=Rhodopirellula islandica TaxID=595434 RepID=A0A0J1BA83_RHOIS|nr:hypothetical protein RISK_004042 [Rhodopirellula islandica]
MRLPLLNAPIASTTSNNLVTDALSLVGQVPPGTGSLATLEKQMVAGVWFSPRMGPSCLARGGSPERPMPKNKRSPRMGPS